MKTLKKETEFFCPSDSLHWRKWLQKNHIKKESVWLICYKKKTSGPSVVWSDLVDEALCFGWIDSIRKSFDKERYIQFFSKRKDVSTWSRINKEKIARLTREGRMMPAGLERIEIAKANGSWTILDKVESLAVPADLRQGLKMKFGSIHVFSELSHSEKRRLLLGLALAKQASTRKKRVNEILRHCGAGIKSKKG